MNMKLIKKINMQIQTENNLRKSLEEIRIKNNISKKQISIEMSWSYPTTLYKLQNPYFMTITELKSVCWVLGLDFKNTLIK